MTDRPAHTQEEIDARKQLVALAKAMLSGQLKYLEGANRVFSLQHKVGGVENVDEDFMPFNVVRSETDHLPLEAQRPLWSPSALLRLTTELEDAEKWAASITADACKKIVERFDGHDS